MKFSSVRTVGPIPRNQFFHPHQRQLKNTKTQQYSEMESIHHLVATPSSTESVAPGWILPGEQPPPSFCPFSTANSPSRSNFRTSLSPSRNMERGKHLENCVKIRRTFQPNCIRSAGMLGCWSMVEGSSGGGIEKRLVTLLW